MRACPICSRRFDAETTPFAVISESSVSLVCSARCAGKIPPSLASQWLLAGPHRGPGISLEPRRLLMGAVLLLATSAVLYMILHAAGNLGEAPSETPFRNFPRAFPGRTATFSSPSVKQKMEDALPEKTEEYQVQSQNILMALLEKPCESLWEIDGVEILAAHGKKPAIAKLRSLLTEEGPRRRLAARALARLGDHDAIIMLRDTLYSKNAAQASSSAFSLGILGDPSALKFLRQLMNIKQTRFSAAEAAAHLGFAPARDHLFHMATRHKRPGDRVRAAQALANAGDLRAIPILLKALHDGTSRYTAALGLAALGKREAIPVLNQAVKHISLRIVAARHLARLGSYDAVKYLYPHMVSDFMPQKITAAGAIFILTSSQLAAENKSASAASPPVTWLVASLSRLGSWLRL